MLKLHRRRAIITAIIVIILSTPILFSIYAKNYDQEFEVPANYNPLEMDLDHFNANSVFVEDRSDYRRYIDEGVTFLFKDKMIEFRNVYDQTNDRGIFNGRILIRISDNEKQSGWVRFSEFPHCIGFPSAAEFQGKLYILYKTTDWRYLLISYDGTEWEGPIEATDGHGGYYGTLTEYQDKLYILWNSGVPTWINYRWFDGTELGPMENMNWNGFEGPMPSINYYKNGITPVVRDGLLILPLIQIAHGHSQIHIHLLYTNFDGENWSEPVKRYYEREQGGSMIDHHSVTPIKDGVAFGIGVNDNENETYTLHLEIVKGDASVWENITHDWGPSRMSGCVIDIGYHIDPVVTSYKDGILALSGIDMTNNSLHYYDGEKWISGNDTKFMYVHDAMELDGAVFFIQRYPWRLSRIDPEELSVVDIKLPRSSRGIYFTGEEIISGTYHFRGFQTNYRFNGSNWELIGTIKQD